MQKPVSEIEEDDSDLYCAKESTSLSLDEMVKEFQHSFVKNVFNLPEIQTLINLSEKAQA